MDILHLHLNDAPHTSIPSTACIGFFDGVHKGHQSLLHNTVTTAQNEGFRSIAITFERHPLEVIRKNFRARLLTPLPEKLKLIAAMGIDLTVVLHFDSKMALLDSAQFMQQILQKQLHVKHLIMGYDNSFGSDHHTDFAHYEKCAAQLGIKATHAPSLLIAKEEASSSAIRKALEKGNITRANLFLGRPYKLQGTVTHGRGEGHRIGFPTANLIPLDAQKQIPAKGVYAVRVHTSKTNYGGMLNIGNRPTFNNGNDVTIEVHIFNYNEDAYNTIIHIDFISFIRNEHKFASLKELQHQLYADLQEAQHQLQNYANPHF